MNYSPLRYPGGKTKIAPLVNAIMENAKIKNGVYIEPFAGGAGVALTLLLRNNVSHIVINDMDTTIYAFWYSVLNYNEEFIQLIKDTPITIEEWYNQKKIFLNNNVKNILELGFATFFLNRTNRSGILKAGPIGGYNQTGKYSIDVRFNKEDLITRIKRIGEYRDKISLFNLEIKEFINSVLSEYESNAFVYFDPPYYKKGHELYINFFKPEDHQVLAELIKQIKIDWMVTYDNTEEVKAIYKDREQKIYDLNYSLANKGKNSEIIVLSRDLWLTSEQQAKLKIQIR